MGAPDSLHLLLVLREVIKGRTHKYLRRYRGKDGKYRYVYPKKKASRHRGGGTDHKSFLGDKKIYQPGTSFAAGGGKGHYIIESVKGNTITFHLDEDETGAKGEARTMSYADFRNMLRSEHRESFKRAAREGLQRRKDVLARTMPDTPAHKRALNEVLRWESANSDYLPRGAARKRAFGALSKFVKDSKERSEAMRTLLGVESFTQARTEDVQALAVKLESASPTDFQRMLHGADSLQQDKNDPRAKLAKQNLQRHKKELAAIEEDLATARRGGDTPRIQTYEKEHAEQLERVKFWEGRVGDVSKGLVEVIKAKMKDGKGRWVTTKTDRKIFINSDGVPTKGNPHIIARMKGEDQSHRSATLDATQRGMKAATKKLGSLGSLPKSYGEAAQKIGELEKIVQRAKDAHSHAKNTGLMTPSGSDTAKHKETRKQIEDGLSAIKSKIEEYKKASPHSDHIVRLMKLSSSMDGGRTKAEVKKALLELVLRQLRGAA